jgi:hypothetical protein
MNANGKKMRDDPPALKLPPSRERYGGQVGATASLTGSKGLEKHAFLRNEPEFKTAIYECILQDCNELGRAKKLLHSGSFGAETASGVSVEESGEGRNGARQRPLTHTTAASRRTRLNKLRVTDRHRTEPQPYKQCDS